MKYINISAPFQTEFTIETSCAKIIDSLFLKHGKYATFSNECAKEHITIAVDGKNCKITYRNNSIHTRDPFKTIEDLMYENRKYDSSIFAIHGGAVEHNGEAYLIIAATTSGKTTLTSFLVEHGFGYITDDCILLDREHLLIYPNTTPIHLRQGGYDVLKKLDAAPNRLQTLDSPSFYRYTYTPQNYINVPLPIKRIFFINRTQNQNKIEYMTPEEKIIALLKSPITYYKISSDYLSFIAKLTSLPCEKLFYSDMNFVYEVIKNDYRP